MMTERVLFVTIYGSIAISARSVEPAEPPEVMSRVGFGLGAGTSSLGDGQAARYVDPRHSYNTYSRLPQSHNLPSFEPVH